nr:MAG TPA: hypothetical protein [Caudoviricetes sp.]
MFRCLSFARVLLVLLSFLACFECLWFDWRIIVEWLLLSSCLRFC